MFERDSSQIKISFFDIKKIKDDILKQCFPVFLFVKAKQHLVWLQQSLKFIILHSAEKKKEKKRNA